MDRLTLDTLRQNAYRVLGLTSSATQSDIDSAARMMRLWENQAAPPTPNDAPWLGAVPRTTQDIEFALMRLTGPETRALERLWWFCQPPPADCPRPDYFPAHFGSTSEPATAHDQTLLRLCATLPEGTSIEHWRDILPHLRELSTRQDYLDWMIDIETAGDFEKRALPDELRRIQSNFAEAAYATLITIADRHLREESYPSAGRIVEILHEASEGAPGPASDAEHLIVERMDDALTGKCVEYRQDINHAWNSRNLLVIRGSCESILNKCEQRLIPLFQTILRWSPADSAREDRLRGQITNVYIHVSKAYEACHDYPAARRALQKSAEISRGTIAEPQIAQRVTELAAAKQSAPTPRRRRFLGIPLTVCGVLLWIAIRFIIVAASTSPSYRADDLPPYRTNVPLNMPDIQSHMTDTQRRQFDDWNKQANELIMNNGGTVVSTAPARNQTLRPSAGTLPVPVPTLPPALRPASQPSTLTLKIGELAPLTTTPTQSQPPRPTPPNPLRLGSP